MQFATLFTDVFFIHASNYQVTLQYTPQVVLPLRTAHFLQQKQELAVHLLFLLS